MQIIVFTLENRHYGFSTEKVDEITSKLEATELPQGPKWASGLVNLRGQVMTLIDLNALLNGTGEEENLWYNNTVIVKTEANPLALKVGRVIGVTDIDESDYQSKDSDEDAVITGLVSAYDEIVSIIELDKLFAEQAKDPVTVEE